VPSRSELAVLLVVLLVVAFLFWSRNAIVRAPSAPGPRPAAEVRLEAARGAAGQASVAARVSQECTRARIWATANGLVM
jgi:hypothetical protein